MFRIEGYKPEVQERERGGKSDDVGKHFLRELSRVVDEVVPLPEVAIVGEYGKPAWGVETRTVAADTGDLVYAVNVSPSPIRVKLVATGRRLKWLRGTEFQSSTTLPPLHTVLLNILDTVGAVEKLVAFYVQEHNSRLPHSAFRGQTPDEIYFKTGG